MMIWIHPSIIKYVIKVKLFQALEPHWMQPMGYKSKCMIQNTIEKRKVWVSCAEDS